MADKFAQAYTLLSKYTKFYTGRYGSTPVVNKYREKWGMQDVIDSVGSIRALELLEYYFRVDKPGHPLVWFYQNFDRLAEIEEQQRRDRERIERIRQQSTEAAAKYVKERTNV